MKKMNSLTLAVGAAFATTVLSAAAFAGSNPFAMQKLDSGYQLAAADANKKMDGSCGDKMKDGKCGEGKCGADMKKVSDGKCGADKKKDGSCGAGKKMEETTETPKTEEAK